MTTRFSERIVWHLASLTLGDDAYGPAILGDLLEGRALVAQESGDRAASRWLMRQALRSWIAFLPALERRGRDMAVAAALAGVAYAMAVNGVGPLTIRIANSLGLTGVSFDLLYVVMVALVGAVAGLATFATRRGSPAGVITFIILAVTLGAHHVIESNSRELVFRLVKVGVFVVSGLIGTVVAVLAHRLPREVVS